MVQLCVSIIVAYCFKFEITDAYTDELENLNNDICEEMLHPTSNDNKFVSIWGRILKIFYQVYQLMDNGDSKGYAIAKQLIGKGVPSCFSNAISIKELKENYNLSIERTDFLYGLMSTTRFAYTLIEIKYNMTDLENYKKSLYCAGNNITETENQTVEATKVTNYYENPKLGPEEEAALERNECVPDFRVL